MLVLMVTAHEEKDSCPTTLETKPTYLVGRWHSQNAVRPRLGEHENLAFLLEVPSTPA